MDADTTFVERYAVTIFSALVAVTGALLISGVYARLMQPILQALK